ncbi:hypothetical protein QJS04_geneDACA009947 [Acorus gramineus]|uniref:Uncharacterized protein n=1 Tax=Acorus gramineus TaxID=55184 RepID=A0AAV9BGI7_ACOGR|nr:hypothetical protein QJS04_geneDACA009947 [Acorus gramineus]
MKLSGVGGDHGLGAMEREMEETRWRVSKVDGDEKVACQWGIGLTEKVKLEK